MTDRQTDGQTDERLGINHMSPDPKAGKQTLIQTGYKSDHSFITLVLAMDNFEQAFGNTIMHY